MTTNTTNYSDLRVSQLRALCKEKNVDTTGFLEKGDFVKALENVNRICNGGTAAEESTSKTKAAAATGAAAKTNKTKNTRRATVAASANNNTSSGGRTPAVEKARRASTATAASSGGISKNTKSGTTPKKNGGVKAAAATGRRDSSSTISDAAKSTTKVAEEGKATTQKKKKVLAIEDPQPKKTTMVAKKKRASVATPSTTNNVEDPKVVAGKNRRQSTPAASSSSSNTEKTTSTTEPSPNKPNKRGSLMTAWLAKKVTGRKKSTATPDELEEEEEEKKEEKSPVVEEEEEEEETAPKGKWKKAPENSSSSKTKTSPARSSRRKSNPATATTTTTTAAASKATPKRSSVATANYNKPTIGVETVQEEEVEEENNDENSDNNIMNNSSSSNHNNESDAKKRLESPPTSPLKSALKSSSLHSPRGGRVSPGSSKKGNKKKLPGLIRKATKRRLAVIQQPVIDEDMVADFGSDSEEEEEEMDEDEATTTTNNRKGVAFALPASDDDDDDSSSECPSSDDDEDDFQAKRASFLATKRTRCRKARFSFAQRSSFPSGPLPPGAFDGLDDLTSHHTSSYDYYGTTTMNDSSHGSLNNSSHHQHHGLNNSSQHSTGTRRGMDDSSHTMMNDGSGGSSRRSRRRRSSAARGSTRMGARRRSSRRRSSAFDGPGRRKTCTMEDWRRRSTWQGDNSWMKEGTWHSQNSTNYEATDIDKAFKEAPAHKWKTDTYNVGGSEPITLWVGEMKKCEGKSIKKAIEKFKKNPHKYCALMYQTNMITWSKAKQKYTFVMRVGDELVTPQGVTEKKKEAWMTVMIHQFRQLPAFPNNNTLPESHCDEYTRTMTYQGQTLPPPILPGRGMGTADMPNLKIIGDIDPSDIAQGRVEDCWLLSAISSLAEFDGAIKKLFRKTKDLGEMPFDDGRANKYTITLYDLETPGDTWEEVDYEIDESLCAAPNPAYPGELLGARPSEDGELWVCYLEKALAIHFGGWDAIAGGKCTHAWAAMTGCQRQYQIIKNHKTGKYKCYGKYNSATKECKKHFNSPMLDADTWEVPWPRVGGGGNAKQEFDDDQLYDRMCAWDDYNYIVGAGTKAGLDTTEGNLAEGIVEDHAYSIIDCHPNVAGTGIDLLKIRNPWGEGEIENGDFDDDGPGWALFPEIGEELKPVVADDGIFYLTKEEFFELFDHIYLSCSNMTLFKED